MPNESRLITSFGPLHGLILCHNTKKGTQDVAYGDKMNSYSKVNKILKDLLFLQKSNVGLTLSTDKTKTHVACQTK